MHLTRRSSNPIRNSAPLSTERLQWFYERYLTSPADRANIVFSVLRADLQGLPPATVITADVDPLRSEGAAYAQKLTLPGLGLTTEITRA